MYEKRLRSKNRIEAFIRKKKHDHEMAFPIPHCEYHSVLSQNRFLRQCLTNANLRAELREFKIRRLEEDVLRIEDQKWHYEFKVDNQIRDLEEERRRLISKVRSLRYELKERPKYGTYHIKGLKMIIN